MLPVMLLTPSMQTRRVGSRSARSSWSFAAIDCICRAPCKDPFG